MAHTARMPFSHAVHNHMATVQKAPGGAGVGGGDIIAQSTRVAARWHSAHIGVASGGAAGPRGRGEREVCIVYARWRGVGAQLISTGALITRKQLRGGHYTLFSCPSGMWCTDPHLKRSAYSRSDHSPCKPRISVGCAMWPPALWVAKAPLALQRLAALPRGIARGFVGVACGPRRALVVAGSGGGYLLYYGRVHVHGGNPILAHDGAGLILEKRDVASVEQSGKHKGVARPLLGGASLTLCRRITSSAWTEKSMGVVSPKMSVGCESPCRGSRDQFVSTLVTRSRSASYTDS